jgi:hypothetical protein
MKYTAYKGLIHEYTTEVKDAKLFDGKSYELADIFPNYGGIEGHKIALDFAEYLRNQGYWARVEAHSGFTAVYCR